MIYGNETGPVKEDDMMCNVKPKDGISALECRTAIEYHEGMITESLPCFDHLKRMEEFLII